MSQVLVVGDDLTGSNGTAAGFTRAGLRSVTLRSDTPVGTIADHAQVYDTLVLVTDSRHLPAEQATELTAQAVLAAGEVRFVASRCDSTLRGNVGVQAAAVLSTLRGRGARAVGLCMPAYPSAGRQTVGGNQLVDGVRLEQTELARDVRSPMRTSNVEEILRAGGTGLKTRTLKLSTITGNTDYLVAAIRDALFAGIDVLVADAFTDAHLDRVARAAVAASAQVDPDLVWVGIDPGPGSLAIAEALGLSGATEPAPLLAVSGSATDLTMRQFDHLSRSLRPTQAPVPGREGSARATGPAVSRGPTDRACVHLVKPVYPSGSRIPDVDRTVAVLARTLDRAATGDVVVLATVLEPGDVVALGAEASERLPLALGEIAAATLRSRPVGGLFTTGGDITTAVLGAVGAHGIEVTGEVVPLAATGHLVGGQHAGLPVVTKGGLVGSTETTLHCVEVLREAAERAARDGGRTPVQPAAEATCEDPGQGASAAEDRTGPTRTRRRRREPDPDQPTIF
ncbi:four-carbon acid sugar kinase family protein [Brevibacterium litoralis]|uniref:four-carbon acid sugar kinase family protein n=1 Tax=Brevibacterium litoralis TaxID=3138935 RepID=UPI0032EA964D